MWERRLLSDFTVAPVESCSVEEPPQGAEQARTNFQRLVRSMGLGEVKKTSRLWQRLALAARRSQQVARIEEEKVATTKEFSIGTEDSVDIDATQCLPVLDIEILENLVNFESVDPEPPIVMHDLKTPKPIQQNFDLEPQVWMQESQLKTTVSNPILESWDIDESKDEGCLNSKTSGPEQEITAKYDSDLPLPQRGEWIFLIGEYVTRF